MEQSVISNSPTSTPVPTNTGNLLVAISALVALVMGGMGGYLAYPLINKPNQEASKFTQTQNVTDSSLTAKPTLVPISPKTTSAPSTTFCNQYGTFTISKNELLETYTTGVGDTLRSIAKDKLGDQTKALDLINPNPSLRNYEVDDALPMRTTIYLPNSKYDQPNITAYIKAQGNIVLNKEKPMFGIGAPNSGTGPFTITNQIKADLANIKDGDCVEVIYGSRGFDQEKPVFEVIKQN